MHPSEPTVNLGDTSFLDALGGPGFALEEIGDASHSGEVTAGTGHPIFGSGSLGVNSISSLTHGVAVSHKRFLGAWYGIEVIVVAAHVSADLQRVAGGLGDLTVSPLVLQWNRIKLGSTQLNQRFVLDSELPVGQYRQNGALNLSSHTFTVHPYYAFSFFPTSKIETSWRTSYLYNTANHALPTAANTRSTQAGQAVHFNATLSYKLPHQLWLGANGYYLNQVTDPKINGRALPGSPERVGSIGPGMVWDRGQYLIFVNGYHEIGALNRPVGNRLVLRVEWVPGRHPGIGSAH